MVYKLVELAGIPRIKVSQDSIKVTIPGRKEAYRLCGESGVPILDLLVRVGAEKVPEKGVRILCQHPFSELKRVYVTPSKVIPLHKLVWNGKENIGKIPRPSLADLREKVKVEMTLFRSDVLRPLNPTPYKVSVSSPLYTFIHELWMKEVPIAELN